MTEAININLGDAKDPFAAIEEGTYTIEVVSAELGASKSGEQMVSITFQVIGHDEHSGHMIFENYMMEGRGARFGVWGLKNVLDAIGYEGSRQLGEIDWDDLKGLSGDALLEVTPAQGQYKESNSVKDWV